MQKSFTVDFWLGSKYGSWRYCQNINCTGWPTKMSLFFFGNNFYKNKETFKIFSPQILEVYRILLVETTLESIMFYYTFSVINTMFVPCTVLLYDSTSSNSNTKIAHNSIEHFLWNPSDFFSDVLSCLWIVFVNSVFQVPPKKIIRQVNILGIRWPGVIALMQNESVPWEVMPEVVPHFSFLTFS